MPIAILCPECDTRLNAPDATAGTTVKCPKCKTPMVIPMPGPEVAAADEPTSSPKTPAPAARKRGQMMRDTEAEDDGRPRPRRKKKPVRSSPPWVLIGGAAAVLVAVVVIGGLAAIVAFSRKALPPPATPDQTTAGQGTVVQATADPRARPLPVVRKPRATLTAEQNRPVGAIALSADGRLAATADRDVVRVWDMDPPGERATLPVGKGPIHSVALSPDGKTVAAAGVDGVVHLWDVGSKTERTFAGTGTGVFAFSPDGKELAVLGSVVREVQDQRFGKVGVPYAHVAVHDVATGKARDEWTGERASYAGLAFLKGGTLLANTEAGGVVLRNAATGEVLAALKSPPGHIRTLAASADGRVLATCNGDKAVRLWNPDGSTTGTLPNHATNVRTVALTPDGSILVAANGDYALEDKAVIVDEARVWDVNTRQARAVVSGQRGWMGAVAITPDGKTIVTGGADGVIRFWDIPTPGSTPDPEQTASEQSDAVTALGRKHGGKVRREGSEVVELDLTGARVGDTEVGVLAEAKRLRKLRLDRTAVTDTGLDRLRGSTELVELGVVGTPITESAAASFRKALPGCTVFWSRDDFVNALINQQYDLPAAVRACNGRVKTDPDGAVTSVNLGWTKRRITDEALSRLKGLPKLRELQLYGDTKLGYEITDAGLEVLTDLTTLENVSVAWTRVTDAGLIHLKGLTRLKYLDVRGTMVSDAGLDHLAGLTNLSQISATGAKVTEAGVAKLRLRLPRLNVVLK
ncbi:hypothetical protein [Fimbriiglobus ruber]|uniref:High-affnity carbon uptake protein Hat/HatR n=1 Tax=Fimbriiglobus ruber TaxID=1908690 RepID=A0A225DDQ7_9BACT|nr:hypothetical protein [Fimbriiglobus ruber]OWK34535.1 High-affnity carbon uptake protein Hat/HatR [Fimbriiglobus ruber]